MFMHGSWDHILGNMLFLAIFGKNVEDAFGHLRYLAFYIVGGFVACATQTAVTLIAGSASAAMVPVLGASGAIAAVLGAYFVLYPNSRVLTLVLVFPLGIPPGCSLASGLSISSSKPTSAWSGQRRRGRRRILAHVGGFLFGVIVASGLGRAEISAPRAGASEPSSHNWAGPLRPPPGTDEGSPGGGR